MLPLRVAEFGCGRRSGAAGKAGLLDGLSRHSKNRNAAVPHTVHEAFIREERHAVCRSRGSV